MNKYFSRKFIVTLGAILVGVGGALSGQTDWTQATWTTLIAVLGYLGVEGARDIKLSAPPKE